MRIRICINKHDDLIKDLEVAGRLRRDLWAHSPVEIDPDDPATRTRRSRESEAYFEFETEFADEVRRVVSEHGYTDRVRVLCATANGLQQLSLGQTAS